MACMSPPAVTSADHCAPDTPAHPSPANRQVPTRLADCRVRALRYTRDVPRPSAGRGELEADPARPAVAYLWICAAGTTNAASNVISS